MFGQQSIKMGALAGFDSTSEHQAHHYFFERIFDEANSCSRRSQDLLDKITDTTATLESMCKPHQQDTQFTDSLS